MVKLTIQPFINNKNFFRCLTIEYDELDIIPDKFIKVDYVREIELSNYVNEWCKNLSECIKNEVI